MRKQTSLLATSCVLLLAFASAASAQKTTTLDQVDAAIKRGDAATARATLDRWQKNAKGNVDLDTQARATFLSAKLTRDADEAETEYLHVAVSYSTSPYAAEATFRIAQARMAAGDVKQANIYFKRVLTDFPKSEFAALAKKYAR